MERWEEVPRGMKSKTEEERNKLVPLISDQESRFRCIRLVLHDSKTAEPA